MMNGDGTRTEERVLPNQRPSAARGGTAGRPLTSDCHSPQRAVAVGRYSGEERQPCAVALREYRCQHRREHARMATDFWLDTEYGDGLLFTTGH
eukprot:gene14835-biopygen10056